MPAQRVEKICSDFIKFHVFRRAGENVVLEGMMGENLYFVRRGLFVS